MSEKDTQDTIMEYLNKMKIGSFERISNLPAYDKRLNSYRRPSKYSKKGVCDIIGCLNGRFIGIEVKTRREFEWVLRFWIRIKKANELENFKPTTKKEDHVLNQIKYISDKNNHGAFCFFTYSLEHTLKKLGEIDESRMCIQRTSRCKLDNASPE